MTKRTTDGLKLSTRLERLIGALQREEQSLGRLLSNPNTGARATVRFTAQAKVLHNYIDGLQEAALVVEEDLMVALVSVVMLIHEDRVKAADTIHAMREDLWTTDEETPEEEKLDKDYPQLWIPTAEHDMMQRLQKQIQAMLKAHEENRQ